MDLYTSLHTGLSQPLSWCKWQLPWNLRFVKSPNPWSLPGKAKWSSSFSGEVTSLRPGSVVVSLFHFKGAANSWCSWSRFIGRELRDEVLNSRFYSITSESSEGANLFMFAVCAILLVMKVRVAVWKPKVLSDHASGFGWHLAKKLVFSLVFSPIPQEQGGHRFDWKELVSFLDTHLFLCISQIFQTQAQNSFLTQLLLCLLISWSYYFRESNVEDKMNLISPHGASHQNSQRCTFDSVAFSSPWLWPFAAVTLQKTLIFGWIQNLCIQTQFSALSSQGKEEQEGKRTGQRPPTSSAPWPPGGVRGAHLVPSHHREGEHPKGSQTGIDEAEREIRLLWGLCPDGKRSAAKGQQVAGVCSQRGQERNAGARWGSCRRWKRAGSRCLCAYT